MRRLSPFVFLAAAGLILSIPLDEASAAGRGHGFGGKGLGFAGKGFGGRGFAGRGHFGGHRHGFRGNRTWLSHDGRVGRGAVFGGFWPGYGGYYDDAYGGRQMLIQQNVATSATSYPTVLDLPGSTGIRSEPAAQPVIYVIKSAASGRDEAPLVRKGSRDRPGAKLLAMKPGREVATTGSVASGGNGPRIIEVTARRGL